VKPVWEDASVGIDDESVIDAGSRDELRLAMAARREKVGGEVFAETYIDGREFNLSLLGDRNHPRVLPAAEIEFVNFPGGKPRIVGYAAKWDESSFEYRATARRFDFPAADAPLLSRLGDLAVECWRCFGLSGYARVDFRVDAAGRPFVLEVNANPCLSPDAGFQAAASRAGLSFCTVVEQITRSCEKP
jgi:D-alanine-D-alanine ligase